jgi:DnaK suppressor protein
MRARNRLTEPEREKLERELEETQRKLARMREYLRYEVDASIDEGDPDIYEREKNFALVQSLERKVESITHALRLAEAGNYGICERCGKAIDPARLEALPDASMCLKCQKKENGRARAFLTTGSISDKIR